MKQPSDSELIDCSMMYFEFFAKHSTVASLGCPLCNVYKHRHACGKCPMQKLIAWHSCPMMKLDIYTLIHNRYWLGRVRKLVRGLLPVNDYRYAEYKNRKTEKIS